MRILLAEADQRLLNQIQTQLTKQNFVVDVASDGEVAWELLHSFTYDLILLEISLPRLDGITLCRRIRAVGNLILVVLMTNPDHLKELVEGLKVGADDCLIKPINEQELLARIQALGRRGLNRAKPVLSWGPLQLDPIAKQVTCNDQVLKIGRKEYQLLELFLRHPHRMFTRSDIADRLWTTDEDLPTDATVKSHIRSVRRKLEKAGAENLIETRYGHGYRLNPIFDSDKVASSPVLSPATSLDNITANTWHELMATNVQLQQEIEMRKQIEAQLRRSELLLRNAQQAARIGAWEYDLRTKETYWTEELYHIHGLDPRRPEPIRDEIMSLIHPEDIDLYKREILIPSQQGKSFEANLRIIRHNDGEVRYINARGGLIFDESGHPIKLTGTTFDITDFPSSSPPQKNI